MARVFLDANAFINFVERQGNMISKDLEDHDVFISPLSVHILLYIIKQKIPYVKLLTLIELFSITPFDKLICDKSLNSPTDDFEDNVQLHSAAQAECDFFLTEDKKLLAIKFFGKAKMVSNLKTA